MTLPVLAVTVARCGAARCGVTRTGFVPKATTNEAGTAVGPFYLYREDEKDNADSPGGATTWTVERE